jgi:hypothetical protein
MKKTLLFALLVLLVVPAGFCTSTLLRLQRSEELGPGAVWQEVPANTLPITAGGALQDTFEAPTGFYRLRIDPGGEWGLPLTLPLEDVPALARTIAKGVIEEVRNMEGDNPWEDGILGPIAFPIYGGVPGDGPAFIEFKVISMPGDFQLGGAGPLQDQLPPPLAACNQDRGFILVSLTEDYSPVLDFATEGLTRTECLRKQANTSAVKIVRYDDSFMVAENEKGELLARTGPMPVHYPDEALDYCDKGFEGFAEVTGEQVPDPPNFKPEQYESYEAFKKDYLESKFFEGARGRQREEAVPEWDVVLGRLPKAITVLLDQPTLILEDLQIKEFTLENARLARIEIERLGLLVTGLQVGSSMLHVLFADGSEADYILVVEQQGALSPEQPTGWSAWTYYYAGNWGDQRRYTQEWGTYCWSGCGATAWAMDYGWFDYKGYCNAIDGVAPLYNNNAVRDCIWYIVPQIGTWCAGSSGATNPWDMYKGYKWAQSRGHGYSVSWAWTVPCFSWSTCREKARDSIRDLGRPAIIGIGCTGAHYPLAYGYAWQEYTWAGITWSYNRWFKCNMGWGGGSPEWKKASVWYGQKNNFW